MQGSGCRSHFVCEAPWHGASALGQVDLGVSRHALPKRREADQVPQSI